jgi:hypothetical protein
MALRGVHLCVVNPNGPGQTEITILKIIKIYHYVWLKKQSPVNWEFRKSA